MIGYYVHHHGDGHRQRAIAIANAMGGGVTLLGAHLSGRAAALPCIDLPDDRLSSSDFTGMDGTHRPNALHYAPIDHDGIRRRVALVTAWIADCRPSLIVVDVSAEMAMLASLASVPTVYVRLNGHRADTPHLEAFRGATALLAPFHKRLDDRRTSAWVRAKTFFAPGIMQAAMGAPVKSDMVLGVVGRGNGPFNGDLWADAARAVPDKLWHVIGPCTAPTSQPSNLKILGWIENAGERIAQAGIVVGAAGDGLVGSIIAHRRPFICVPEPRPFDEQRSKADRLAKLGAAVVSSNWPGAQEWPALIARAAALDPAILADLGMERGAHRVSDWLRALLARDQHMEIRSS